MTGATGGLGYETALGLAHAGADVVLAGRNREKGRVAVERIMSALPAAKVRFEMLDLASLASVRAFAEEMVAKGEPGDRGGLLQRIGTLFRLDLLPRRQAGISLSGALYRAAKSFTTQKWRKGANNGHA